MLAPLMSKGYKIASDKAQPFEIVVPSPAGALSASGADMARFMIAHLQDGRYEGAQILRPETAKLMHARQRGKSPETDGMALGFYEESRNGHRIIGHGGDTNWFHSDLHLIPDANVGFFVSYNSGGNGKGSGRTLLWEQFLDRYFPYTPPAVPRASDAKEQAKRVSGNYLVSRRDDTKFLRLLYLLEQTKVYPSPKDEGAIEISALTGYNEQPKKWEPIGNGVFRAVNGQEKVVFQKDPLGRDEMVTEYPFFDFFRPPAYLDAKIVLPVAIVSLSLVVLALILWPVGAWVRKHYGRRLELPPGELRLRKWTRWVCLLYFVLVAGYGIIIIKGLSDLDLFTPKLDPWLHVLQVIAGARADWDADRAAQRGASLGQRAAEDLEQARRDVDRARVPGDGVADPRGPPAPRGPGLLMRIRVSLGGAPRPRARCLVAGRRRLLRRRDPWRHGLRRLGRRAAPRRRRHPRATRSKPSAISRRPPPARTVDATGLAVAPGFINMLSWSTDSLIVDGRSQSELRQGVTTQIFGEGFSMGPLEREARGRPRGSADRHQVRDPLDDARRVPRVPREEGHLPERRVVRRRHDDPRVRHRLRQAAADGGRARHDAGARPQGDGGGRARHRLRR